jgi:hypothetical protein
MSDDRITIYRTGQGYAGYAVDGFRNGGWYIIGRGLDRNTAKSAACADNHYWRSKGHPDATIVPA